MEGLGVWGLGVWKLGLGQDMGGEEKVSSAEGLIGLLRSRWTKGIANHGMDIELSPVTQEIPPPDLGRSSKDSDKVGCLE